MVETQRYGDSINRLNDLPDQDEEVRTEEITRTDLVINNLQFSFEENKKIFDNFNLEVKKGEHIAILGRSGVGKSTLPV
ncbi:Alpha-hemolysin translocation ATP-binding protein HlyB [Lactococcus lactis]|nr:Alpha-hemolysin translocation ATP-binding protein HlyB [Lactococcus lactis]